MKKLRLFVTIILVLSITMPVVKATEGNAAAKGYYFKYAKVSVTMGSNAKKFIKKAGKPKSKDVSKSCSFKGNDIKRTYADFILYTYTNSADGPEYINGITFKTSKVKTKEGIKIGSTEDTVLKKYGDAKPVFNVYTYTKGKTNLNIQVKDGKVKNIRYVLKK